MLAADGRIARIAERQHSVFTVDQARRCGLGSSAIHITVTGERRVRVSRVVIHRPHGLTRRDVSRIGVVPITSPARTMIDLAAVVSEPVLENAVDEARRRGLLSVPALARRVDAMSPNGRRGVLRLRRLLRERLGEAVPGSKWETRLKQLLRDNGLPPPAAQFEIFAADGRLVGRPDLVYPRAKLFIEFDGYAFHSSRIAWEDGIARQNELVGLG